MSDASEIKSCRIKTYLRRFGFGSKMLAHDGRQSNIHCIGACRQRESIGYDVPSVAFRGSEQSGDYKRLAGRDCGRHYVDVDKLRAPDNARPYRVARSIVGLNIIRRYRRLLDGAECNHIGAKFHRSAVDGITSAKGVRCPDNGSADIERCFGARRGIGRDHYLFGKFTGTTDSIIADGYDRRVAGSDRLFREARSRAAAIGACRQNDERFVAGVDSAELTGNRREIFVECAEVMTVGKPRRFRAGQNRECRQEGDGENDQTRHHFLTLPEKRSLTVDLPSIFVRTLTSRLT